MVEPGHLDQLLHPQVMDNYEGPINWLCLT
jgi:hypothetical protein